MSKEKKVFASYFVSRRNVLVANLLLIVGGHGHECPVIYSGLWLLERIDGREFPDNVADA